MTSLTDDLRRLLHPAGFDIVAPLQVGRYNHAVDVDYRLPDFGRPTSLAVVVGNSRALWPRLIAALRAEPQRLMEANPLDSYTVAEVLRAVAELGVATEVRHAHEPPPRRVAMQRFAHISGLAHLSSTYLCVHETYGPWIGLRAVIVCDAPGPAEQPVRKAPCDCETGCRSAFDRALAGDDWRDWLAVRDACPVGREHRYSDEQIEYHYVKDRGVLRQLIA